ncbi:MAG TPA: serine/threonine-protein kinase [Polyangiaceae bacterium]
MLLPGRQISPNLRLLRALGAGGMGRVWVAEHRTLETEVAVKLLNADLAEDEKWLARFRREAQAIAKIDSAHVVRVFDHGVTDDGIPYIVMELMRGEDLRTRLERAHGIPLDEAVLVVDQACKALSRAHALGIVHRDIKPENIFLTREGSETFVKLLDFGIAKRVSGEGMDVTAEHTVFGTPYYMSPEQALSTGSVDHRADLWALAVVAFQMLTGERPFVGTTPGAIYVQISAGSFALPSGLRRELPETVDEWFKLALNRDLERRFSSAQDMSRAFRLALHMSIETPRSAVGADPSKTQSSTDSGTAAASVRTVRHLGTQVPRRAFLGFVLFIAALVAGVIGLGHRSNVPPMGAPSATRDRRVTVEAIERTTGLGEPFTVPPPMGAAAATSSASAQAVPKGLGVVPRNVGTRPLSLPPAQATAQGVKGTSASVSPSVVPSATELQNPRPIKDRGF